MPKVSVVIPAYNQAQYLGDAIKSVLDQTYPDFEVIVVDDGSSDDTRRVVDNYSDTRLQYIYQENRGLSGARNTGIRLTSAPYLTFLDSDDLFLPEKLALLVDVLDHNTEIGMVTGQAIIIDERGSKTGKIFDRPVPENLKYFLLNNPLHVGSVLLRRSWQEKVGYFDETLNAYEDWDYWLRLVRIGCKIIYLSKPVSLYRFHRSQMTRDPERMRIASFSMLDKIFLDPKLPQSWKVLKDQAYSRAYLRASAQAYRAGMFDEAKSYLHESVSLNPELVARNAKLLTSHLSGWADDPRTEDPLNFLEIVYDNLPEGFEILYGQKWDDLAETAAKLAFIAYKEQDFVAIRHHFWYAIRNDPKLLFNRGLISIYIRSWFNS